MQIASPETLPIITAGQLNVLASPVADELWYELCDNFLIGQPFTKAEAITKSKILREYSRFTAHNYMNLILRAVLHDVETRPHEYEGMVPLRRLPRRRGREILYVL